MDSLFRETDTTRNLEGDAQLPLGSDGAAVADGNASAVPLQDNGPEVSAEQGSEPAPKQAITETPYGEAPAPLAADRALALTDVIAPRASPGDAMLKIAYRIGISGHVLTAPFRRPAKMRILATVESPLIGDRTAGTALRAGHFLINTAKVPIARAELDSTTRFGAAFDRTIHGFGWLRDLASSAPRADCVPIAERVTKAWLNANPKPGSGPAWEIEHAGHRLIAWIVHAPLVLSGRDAQLRKRLLGAIEETAGWLDRQVRRSNSGLGEVAGWAAITIAGLLLPDGKPRRLYGQSGLIRALGDLVAEDGGVLSRCPAAQMQSIALLTDLLACYEAAEIDPPEAFAVMRELLVPPLLSLRHGDGALGNWQGNGAIPADHVAALIEASGVRARPLENVQQWGFQRIRAGQTVVQMDAAPPPRARHARCGCASTLAFEMSDGAQRLIVNCGGAALAGGQIPKRIAKGLRATAAHSALVLDNANSTAVKLRGNLGKGVELVEVERRMLGASPADGKPSGTPSATLIEAAHDGYAARFGLKHRRTLALSSDGSELSGQDVLLPVSRKGKRGKIGFAIRFHLGRDVEVHFSDDKRGASLLLPDGSLWQFRMRGDNADAKLIAEDSLWVDGEGRPHATEQLVIEGMTSRSGGEFAWLFKKMG
ncbi:MAG: heparinase II/III family protein [Erythrobacter sp.]